MLEAQAMVTVYSPDPVLFMTAFVSKDGPSLTVRIRNVAGKESDPMQFDPNNDELGTTIRFCPATFTPSIPRQMVMHSSCFGMPATSHFSSTLTMANDHAPSRRLHAGRQRAGTILP